MVHSLFSTKTYYWAYLNGDFYNAGTRAVIVDSTGAKKATAGYSEINTSYNAFGYINNYFLFLTSPLKKFYSWTENSGAFTITFVSRNALRTLFLAIMAECTNIHWPTISTSSEEILSFFIS